MGNAANWRSVAIKLLLLVTVVAVIVTFYLTGGGHWLSLSVLQAKRTELLSLVGHYYFLAILISCLVYIGTTTLSIPGGTVLSLLIGFLFGRWVGSVIIVISASIGATLVFIGARYLFADYAGRQLQKSEKVGRLLRGFEKNGFSYLLFLRLVPLFPFWLVNLVPAITKLRVGIFFLATFVGIIPGSMIFANLGQTLGQIKTLDALVSPRVFLALALLGLFALAPVAVRYWQSRHGKSGSGEFLEK